MQNPLLNRKKSITVDGIMIPITNENKYKYFNHVYVLTKVDNNPIPIEFYSSPVEQELYDSIAKRLILKQVSIKILNSYTHFHNMSIISKSVLSKFNILNYDLEDNNIVITVLNTNIIKLESYLAPYSSTTDIEKIYNIIVFSNYFGIYQYNVNSLIENLSSSSYWTKSNICELRISKRYFRMRKFTYDKSILKCDDAKQALDTIEDYINTYGGYSYGNITKYTSKKNYTIYKSLVFTKNDIYELFLKLSQTQRYFLFCNLLVSKDYCYLVLNNYELLCLMKPIIHKYIQIFRYLIGYAWSLFYLNESIKGTMTKSNDPYIFDINTASQLPVFPNSLRVATYNPYSTLFMNHELLNGFNCIGGIEEKVTKNQGIASLDEFKINMNLFTTGDEKADLFENVDFTNIGISGSLMTACCQKYHPLLNNFTGNTTNEKLIKYYNEYYSNADIDIMVKTNDIFNYVQIVNRFYEQIVENACKLNSGNALPRHFKLIMNKKCNFFVPKKFIDEFKIPSFISENDKVNYIKVNINMPHSREVFSSYYAKLIIKPMIDTITQMTDSNDKQIFSVLFGEDVEYSMNINKELNEEIKLSINYKYSITSPHLLHNLEIFQVRYDDFFATVSRFHLPCVRAYYNGTTVLMSPSFITAHLTFMNIDYKYFAGSRDPIEIINKYRMRGFGTWLSPHEIKQYYAYTYAMPFWNVLLDTDDKAGLLVSNRFFRPRLYNEDSYLNTTPVDIADRYSNYTSNYDNKYNTTELDEELLKMYDGKKTKISTLLSSYRTIEQGLNICKLQKWLIPAIYHSYE
jgi:hypothetical protein